MRGDWQSQASEYRDLDTAALQDARIALGICPECGRRLRPAVRSQDGLACVTCDKVFPVSRAAIAKAKG